MASDIKRYLLELAPIVALIYLFAGFFFVYQAIEPALSAQNKMMFLAGLFAIILAFFSLSLTKRRLI